MPTIKNTITNATYELKSSNGSGSSNLVVSGTITYTIWADNCSQTFIDVVNSTPGLLLPGTNLGYSNCIVRSLELTDEEQIDHPVTNTLTRLWTVVANYSNDIDDDGSGDYTNPINRRAKVRYGGDLIEEVHDYDLDLNRIANALGEPLFVTRRRLLPTMEVTQLETYPYPPVLLIVQGYKVNSKPFMGAPRGTVLLAPLEVEEVTEQSIRFNQVRYQFKFNLIEQSPGTLESILEAKGKNLKVEDVAGVFKEDTWRDKVLHEGTKYRCFYTLAERDAATAEAAAQTPPGTSPITANSMKIVDAVDAQGNRQTVNLNGTIPFPTAETAIRTQYIGFRKNANNFGDPVDTKSDDYGAKVTAGLGVPLELLDNVDYLIFRNIDYYDFDKLQLRIG